MERVIGDVSRMKGVVEVKLLESVHKEDIQKIEKENNLGVLECLRKKNIVIAVHDSSFRDPLGPLVIFNGKGFVLPPLPFPELRGVNVMSGSPSKDVHDFLMKKYSLKDHPEFATILIGFDELL